MADSGRPALRRGTWNTEETLGLCFRIIEAVSTSLDRCIATSDLLAQLDIDETELDELIAVINMSNDGHNIARPQLENEGDYVAAYDREVVQIDAIRLSTITSALLNDLLEHEGFQEDERRGVADAVDVRGATTESQIFQQDGPQGRFHAPIARAIERGRRCRVYYRSDSDQQPAWRVVDPFPSPESIEPRENGQCYLTAWDVAKDEERHYRLDKILDFEMLDEPAQEHGFGRDSSARVPKGTLRYATIRLARPDRRSTIAWKHSEQLEVPSGSTPRYRVGYYTESWLFSQVLAAGGDIEIIEPADVRQRFVEFASVLLG